MKEWYAIRIKKTTKKNKKKRTEPKLPYKPFSVGGELNKQYRQHTLKSWGEGKGRFISLETFSGFVTVHE